MGWSSGTRIFSGVIRSLNEANIDESTRKEIYESLWDDFEDADFDVWDELLGEDKAFDELYREKYPEENYLEDEDNSGC